MFIKPSSKYNKLTKERYFIYKLCESYRRDWGTYHHIRINLSKLEELKDAEHKRQLALRIEDMLKNGKNSLPIDTIDEKTEKLAQYFYKYNKAKT